MERAPSTRRRAVRIRTRYQHSTHPQPLAATAPPPSAPAPAPAHQTTPQTSPPAQQTTTLATATAPSPTAPVAPTHPSSPPANTPSTQQTTAPATGTATATATASQEINKETKTYDWSVYHAPKSCEKQKYKIQRGDLSIATAGNGYNPARGESQTLCANRPPSPKSPIASQLDWTMDKDVRCKQQTPVLNSGVPALSNNDRTDGKMKKKSGKKMMA